LFTHYKYKLKIVLNREEEKEMEIEKVIQMVEDEKKISYLTYIMSPELFEVSSEILCIEECPETHNRGTNDY